MLQILMREKRIQRGEGEDFTKPNHPDLSIVGSLNMRAKYFSVFSKPEAFPFCHLSANQDS